MSSGVGVVTDGDVFMIPLGDGTHGLGQVAGHWNEELYLVIYEGRVERSDARPELVVGARPFLGALSFDAKLLNGEWPVIGRVGETLPSLAHPVFRVMQSGEPYIESRDRSLYRPARGDEFARLQFRSVASPQVIEDAVKAHFGLDQWFPGYDRYLYDYALESSRLSA